MLQIEIADMLDANTLDERRLEDGKGQRVILRTGIMEYLGAGADIYDSEEDIA